MARDHLADQAEREELHSDDHEQHAEREQRTAADRVPERLVHRQVDQDPDSDGHEPESEPAEEMQRPVPVTPDERDGQQIEEAAQVALDAVARPPVLTRAMVDGKLGNAEPAVVRKHRNKAVQLTVEAKPVHDFRAVRLQPAVHVVQPHAGEAARDGVEDPGEDASRKRVAAVRLPAGDEIEAFVELREQARNLRGIVLQIAIDGDDRLAVRLIEPGAERSRLAEVPSQPDHADVRAPVVQPRQRGERPVGRTVIDEDRLPLGVQRLEGRAKLVVEECDAPFLVVNRDDDGDHGASLAADRRCRADCRGDRDRGDHGTRRRADGCCRGRRRRGGWCRARARRRGARLRRRCN